MHFGGRRDFYLVGTLRRGPSVSGEILGPGGGGVHPTRWGRNSRFLFYPGAVLFLLPVNHGGSIDTIGLSGGGCGGFSPLPRPSPPSCVHPGDPRPWGKWEEVLFPQSPLSSTRATRITGRDPCAILKLVAQGSQVWPEAGEGREGV